MITVANFNYENGGLRGGRFTFEPLRKTFSDCGPVDLVTFQEAKNYADKGGELAYLAAQALRSALHQPYVISLGYSEGPTPPAIIYNSQTLILRQHYQAAGEHRDKLNLARFIVAPVKGSESWAEFWTFSHHWSPRSPTQRRDAAADLSAWGSRQDLPIIGGGDWNCSPSGPHMPQVEWEQVPFPSRRFKAHKLPNGTWAPITEPMDMLVGRWAGGQRVEGGGFNLVAEAEWRRTGKPIIPTTNPDCYPGEGLLNDAIIANDLAMACYAPGSYTVAAPTERPFPSDHRLSLATFNL